MPYLVAADLPQETAGARFRKLLERHNVPASFYYPDQATFEADLSDGLMLIQVS